MMGGLFSLFNGERAVVLLFISCVLYSLPFSFFFHGVVFSLISLLSFFIEILADSDSSPLSHFKTRPGASSGIFLGSITLPAVILSKLIQISRAFSLHHDQFQFQEELDYLAMQFWATAACCFSVLIFLFFIIRSSGNNPQLKPWGGATFWLSCFTLCAIPSVFFGVGTQTALRLLWVALHGFAAVKLVQHLLRTFPSCASIGEALLVTMGLVIYFGDMLACTVEKLHGYWLLSESAPLGYGVKRSEISTIIQGLLLGLLLFPVVFKFVLYVQDSFFCGARSRAGAHSERGRAFLFFSSLGLIMFLIIPSWMQFILGFQLHPVFWVITFVVSEPVQRLGLCIYWVLVINVCVLKFYSISKGSKIERILLRKYYHLMAVLMFVPAVILQPKFLDLAIGAALAVFLTLEIIRVWRIWPLGQAIHQFMNAFTDHRDSDLLIVSHFSLLLGCALPMWMSSGYNDPPLAPFAGILSLGIGDTMASMVGHKYGVLRWSKTGKKTIEGTAAGITSVLAACSILLPILASAGYIFTQHWFSLLLAVIVSGLLEAYTAQLDNAFIPLVFYSLVCL